MRTVLIFDSGIGGMSVLREVRAVLPAARFVYVADDAGFPYGDWPEAALGARIVGLFGDLVDRHRPDIAVIACNTASTLVLPGLRVRFDVPFVGTVPAIKPAAAATRSGLISVLATPATVRRDYTFDLIAEFAPEVAVSLVGSTRLAAMAEAHIAGETVDGSELATEIAPAFATRDGRRTDIIVLACTHYPFLVDLFRAAAPWPVQWLNPAPAIARRVVQLLARDVAEPADDGRDRGVAYFTSQNAPAPAVCDFLARHGLSVGRR